MRAARRAALAAAAVAAWANGGAPFCAPAPARVAAPRAARRRAGRAAAAGAGGEEAAPPAGEELPFRRARPRALPDTGAPVQPVRELRDSTLLHEVLAGGAVSEEPTYVRDLWPSGLLLVATRRPGCWMSREQARAVDEAHAEAVGSAEGRPRLAAVVRTSFFDEDGSSEVEAFREFFRGDVFVDDYLSVFKALGDRQYTDAVYSEEAGEWMLQRMVGCKGRPVPGNFVGGPDTALKFGGVMLMDSSGKLRYSHQEGIGKIDYAAIKRNLMEM